MHDQYIFSGSLPENASTYVERQADDELYEALLQGKFCYVLNSRQSGKSSLRVRTMSRLSDAGIECAAIDLSSISIQTATQENWYADLIVKLIDSFVLEVDFKSWWEQNNVNSPLLRFSDFLTKILLTEIRENIVIFIDEIDSVISLNFPTDDFFAFIRSCYNLRVDNPEYNRLTFCLLGVASPTSLIQDKNRTPFNIGQAISLKGFQLHEVEPLEKGLHGKFSNPQVIIQEIIQWTGGQPFLTQKLCQFMVEESTKEHPRSVEQVVRSRIIESWESQDEPEHLRTIQARILRDEQRAGYLLELYQQVRLTEEQSELIADETLEQSELQLSGLVVKQQGKLRIYNQIYREIFNLNWIENQLDNLRPYSENFRFWVASGGKDESRLLRGNALQKAEIWARYKNLSYQDKQYLAASKQKEIQDKIAAQEQESAFKRERQDKKAAEARNQLLIEANKKAEQQIQYGTIILALTIIGALISVTIASQKVLEAQNKLQETYTYVAYPKQLTELGKKFPLESEEAIFISEQSKIKIKDPQLEQVYLHTLKSLAYQYLKDWQSAEESNKQSIIFLKGWDTNKNQREQIESSSELLQVKILALAVQGNLLKNKKKINQAREAYQEAFNIFQTHPQLISIESAQTKIINIKIIESIHKNLFEIVSTSETDSNLRKQIEKSFINVLYIQLEYFLKAKQWEAADAKTYQLMLNIAKREKQQYLDDSDIYRFSCPDLQRIDQLWVSNSDKRFGFSVQKQIWISTRNRLGIKPDQLTHKDYTNYLEFAKLVGWYSPDKLEGSLRGNFVSHNELIKSIKDNSAMYRGGLPYSYIGGYTEIAIPGWWSGYGTIVRMDAGLRQPFFSRVATCQI